MRKKLGLFFLMFCMSMTHLHAQAPPPDAREPGQLWVAINSVSTIWRYNPEYHITGVRQMYPPGEPLHYEALRDAYEVSCNCDEQQLFEVLSSDPDVLHVEYVPVNETMGTTSVPNDFMVDLNQWYYGVNHINAQAAWDQIQPGDPRIPIAVTDAGLDFDNTDIMPNIAVLPGGELAVYARVGGPYAPDATRIISNQGVHPNCFFADPAIGIQAGACALTACGSANHGTQTSYLIAGVADNGEAGLGAAHNMAELYFFLGLSPSAMTAASLEGVKAVNCSWGSRIGPSVFDQLRVNEALARGTIVVAAAGNDGGKLNDGCTGSINLSGRSFFFPASYNNSLSVAGTSSNSIWNWDNFKLGNSNYNDVVDLCAPGNVNTMNIERCDGAGLSSYQYANGAQGTSYASPLVTAAIALIYSANPNLSAKQVMYIVKASARDIYGETNNSDFQSFEGLGEGIVDLGQAVTMARNYNVGSTAPYADMKCTSYSDCSISRKVRAGEETDVIEGIAEGGTVRWYHDGEGTLTFPMGPTGTQAVYHASVSDPALVLVTMEVVDPNGLADMEAHCFVFVQRSNICDMDYNAPLTLTTRELNGDGTFLEFDYSWEVVPASAGSITWTGNQAVFTPNATTESDLQYIRVMRQHYQWNGNLCGSISEIERWNHYRPAEVAMAGPDHCGGQIGQNTSTDGMFSYYWQPTTGLDVPTSLTPNANPCAKTEYVLTVINSCFEVSRDTVVVDPACGQSTEFTVTPSATNCNTFELCAEEADIIGFTWTFSQPTLSMVSAGNCVTVSFASSADPVMAGLCNAPGAPCGVPTSCTTHELPLMHADFADDLICLGETFAPDAVPGATYEWYDPTGTYLQYAGPDFTPTAGGDYLLRVSDPTISACEFEATAGVLDAPSPVLGGPYTTCLGEDAVLSAALNGHFPASGEVVILGYKRVGGGSNATARIFFAPLIDLPEGLQIQVTNLGWDEASQSFIGGGFSSTYTVPAGGVTSGSILSVDGASALNSAGDQLLLYTGSAASPYFLFALSTDVWSTGSLSATDDVNSNLPQQLIRDLMEVELMNPGNLARYTGIDIGSADQLLREIADAANWASTGGLPSGLNPLTVTSAYGWTWYQDGILLPGETTAELTTSAGGIYTVSYTHALGCSYEASTAVIVEDFTVAWARPFGGTGGGQPLYTATDVSGNLLVGGTTRSDLSVGDVNSAPLHPSIPITASGRYGYVSKFDNDGNSVWSRVMAQSGTSELTTVKAGPLGDVYIYGDGGSDAYDVLPETVDPFNSAGGSGVRAFLAKLDANGTLQWITFLRHVSANGLTLESDAAGNVTGVFVSGIAVNPTVPETAVISPYLAGTSNAMVARYDDNGVQQWVAYYATPGGGAEARAVALSGDGNVLLAGITRNGGTVHGQTPVSPYGSDRDVFVARFSAANGQLLAHGYSGNPDDEVTYDVVENSQGEIFTMGKSRESGGEEHIALESFSAGLNHQYGRNFGAPDATGYKYNNPLGFEFGFMLDVDSRDNLYLGAFTTGDVTETSAYTPYRATKPTGRADGLLYRLNYEGPGTVPSVDWWTYFGAGDPLSTESAILRGGLAIYENPAGIVEVFGTGPGADAEVVGFTDNSEVSFAVKFACGATPATKTGATAQPEEAEHSPETVLRIFPNPAAGGRFNLEVRGAAPDAYTEFLVYDLFGKEVGRGTLEQGRARVDLSGTSKGIYLISVSDGVHALHARAIHQ